MRSAAVADLGSDDAACLIELTQPLLPLLGFFDFYIIPLTQKLKDCGVFGVSSDEYLNYAKKNREEWEANGEAVVAGMIKECEAKYGVKGDSADKLQIGRRLPRGKAWSSCTGAATMPNGNRA